MMCYDAQKISKLICFYITYVMVFARICFNCQYYYNNSIVSNQISNGACPVRILLENCSETLQYYTRMLRYFQLYFVVTHLVFLFVLLCIMVNDTNINKSKTFTWFKYWFSCFLPVESPRIITLFYTNGSKQ